MSSNGLFYAYAKCVDGSPTFLMTFSRREIADEWYRAVTDYATAGKSNRFKEIKRIGPQFYVHDGDIRATLDMNNVAGAFKSQVTITLLNDSSPGPLINISPVAHWPDHISGKSFYVRSVYQSDIYWTCDSSYGVLASPIRRTKFFVNIVAPSRPAGTVMIGTDHIEISVLCTSGAQSTSLILVGGYGTQLGLQSEAPCPAGGGRRTELPFLKLHTTFSAFRSDFRIGFATPIRGFYKNDVFEWSIAFSPGNGEEWELV